MPSIGILSGLRNEFTWGISKSIGLLLLASKEEMDVYRFSDSFCICTPRDSSYKIFVFLIGPGHYGIKRWLQNTYLDSVTEYMVYFCGK